MKRLTILFIVIVSIFCYAGESKENIITIDPLERTTCEILKCESNFVHEGKWGKAGEYGWAQFKKGTFNWMKELAGMPMLKWKSQTDQLCLLRWALRNNLGSHWSCYKG